MVKLTITTKKDGREVAWYRDSQGRRVGTSMRAATGQMKWSDARNMMELGQTWIDLRRERVRQGIGSEGAPMPPLTGKTVTFAATQKGGFRSKRVGYRETKMRLGLSGTRDLYGPGKNLKGTPGTHMLDDVRVTYVDDQQCLIGISTTASRTKARANERRAAWWASPTAEIKQLADRAAELLGSTVIDRLLTLGVIGANAVAGGGWLRPVRKLLRRAA